MNIWITRLAASKTMWFAVLLDILGVVQANSDFLSTVMDPKQFGYMLIAIGVSVKLLRVVTTQALSDK